MDVKNRSGSWLADSQDGFWRDRRVFVTGCTGLVGSWLTKALLAHEANVVALIRDSTPQSELVRSADIQRISQVRGALDDYALLERTLAEYEIEAIFHLGAQTTTSVANRAPLSTFEANVRGTWLLLEAARRNPTVKRVLIASSDTVYGSQAELPYRETLPLAAVYPYDVSKACVDMIGRSYAQTFELPIAITRCANIYGGGDLNWNRLIPGTVRSVLRGERPVIRSDGQFKRDYLYVKDAVRAYMRTAEALDRPEIHGQPFNFGWGRPVTALGMVQTIIEQSGESGLEPLILNQARSETSLKYVSTAKAESLLGWRPQYDHTAGLAETIAWYRTAFAPAP